MTDIEVALEYQQIFQNHHDMHGIGNYSERDIMRDCVKKGKEFALDLYSFFHSIHKFLSLSGELVNDPIRMKEMSILKEVCIDEFGEEFELEIEYRMSGIL